LNIFELINWAKSFHIPCIFSYYLIIKETFMMHSEELRSRAKTSQELGDSYATITKKLNLSRAAVQSLVSYKIKKFKNISWAQTNY